MTPPPCDGAPRGRLERQVELVVGKHVHGAQLGVQRTGQRGPRAGGRQGVGRVVHGEKDVLDHGGVLPRDADVAARRSRSPSSCSLCSSVSSRRISSSCSRGSHRLSRARSRRRVTAISASMRRTAASAAAVRTPATRAAWKAVVAGATAELPAGSTAVSVAAVTWASDGSSGPWWSPTAPRRRRARTGWRSGWRPVHRAGPRAAARCRPARRPTPSLHGRAWPGSAAAAPPGRGSAASVELLAAALGRGESTAEPVAAGAPGGDSGEGWHGSTPVAGGARPAAVSRAW